MSRSIGRTILRVVVASSAALGGTAGADEAPRPLLPSGRAPAAAPAPLPDGADAPPAHVLGGPRGTAAPLQPAPIEPDPVKFGGFRPKPDPAPNLFYQEGTFLFERPARFQVEADGKAVLRFPPKPGEAKAPFAYVLPNLKRMALEDALKGRAIGLIVSGTVTEFDGANYLLLDDATRPDGAPTTGPATAPAPPRQPGPGRPAAPGAGLPATAPATAGAAKNLSSEQLLSQLLRPAPALGAPGSSADGQDTSARPEPPARPVSLRWEKPVEADRTGGGGAVKPGAPAVKLMREGHYLTDRLGRLSRGAGAQVAQIGNGQTGNAKPTEFVLEADGKALRDPPLIVMPGSKLLIMQLTLLGVIKDPRFRVSGVVTEYRGRNYILLEKVVLVPEVVQSF